MKPRQLVVALGLAAIVALALLTAKDRWLTGGFLAGAAVYTAANIYISRRGGHDRKRSGNQQQQASEGSGVAIAVRAGAPKPDIGSEDAVRDAVIDASSSRLRPRTCSLDARAPSSGNCSRSRSALAVALRIPW